jgi:membrane protein
VSIFGLVVSPHEVAKDLGNLAAAGRDSFGAHLAQRLNRAARADRGGLSIGLGVSVALALWTASAGIYNLSRAIRLAYRLGPDSYVRARLRALAGAFALVLSLGLVGLISSGLAALLDHVPVVLVAVIGIPLLMALVAAVVSGTYRFSIDYPVGLRGLAPGAVFSSVGLLVAGVGFAVYLTFSTRYTALYGALAGVAVAMAAAYMGTYVVLIGAVLNARMTQPRAKATSGSEHL